MLAGILLITGYGILYTLVVRRIDQSSSLT
jgi:hypothetical protein